MHWTSLPSEPPPNDTRTLYGLLAQWQGVYFYGFPAQNPREDPQYHSARANYRCLDHGLSSSFFYLRNSLRQPTEHDHEDDDEGRGRFGSGGALKQVSAYRVSTLGTDHTERRALKGRQIERPNKVEVGVQWPIVTCFNCALTFAPQWVRDLSRSRISRPFRANHLF
jgi:hypothetical protein